MTKIHFSSFCRLVLTGAAILGLSLASTPARAAAGFPPLPQAAGQNGVVDANDPGPGLTYLGPTYTVPSGGDAFAGFYVGLTGTGTVTHSGGTLAISSAFEVGANSGANGTYNLSGGVLSCASFERMGNLGTGTFNQTGGTNTTPFVRLADRSGSLGTYNLSGGTLNTTGISGGSGTSTFNFNGGVLQAGGSTGNLISGLTTANVQAGGVKVDTNGFDITIAQPLGHDAASGAPAVDGGLTKQGGSGTLTLAGANTYTGLTTVSAGTLTFAAGSSLPANNGGLLVSSGATLNLNGTVVSPNGSLDIYGSSNGSTTVTLAAGSTLTTSSTTVARNGGTAVFNQTGGTHNTSVLYIGSSLATTGTYLLSGGTLTAASFQDGRQGTGTFNQSGGAVVVPADANPNAINPTFLVGSAGGNGTYLLSGGTLSTAVAGIGYGGTGAFVQSGGTHTASVEVLVGSSFDSSHPGSGTYTLTGGTLQTPTVSGGFGTSTFNFNGGILQATASDNPGAASNPTTFVSGLTTANVQAGGAKIDTNGFNVTVAQSLLHDPALGATPDGGLTKLGTGRLTLSGTSSYTGGTFLNAGTLAVANSRGLGTGNVTVTGGGQLTLNAGVVITNIAGTTLTLADLTTSQVNLLGATGTVQDTVAALVINGIMQASGTYGASGSGATFNLPDFLGTGELRVGAVPEPSIWALLGLGGAGLLGLSLGQRRRVRLARRSRA